LTKVWKPSHAHTGARNHEVDMLVQVRSCILTCGVLETKAGEKGPARGERREGGKGVLGRKDVDQKTEQRDNQASR
jgi:hypothetical protein